MTEKYTPTRDPAHDVLRYEKRPLDAIFEPRNVAVVGATEKTGSVGRTILWNLISNPFGGTVFPVNPNRPSILGIKAYSALNAIPAQIDLAVVVTPAPTIPGVIRDCVQAGVRGAIVISAGFRETGKKGEQLEAEILKEARQGKMRIIGPNCLGVMSPVTGLNATFAAGMARRGSVGFISQSGALCTAILDWSFNENVGFSSFISIGSMLDVGWGDLIYYLGDDRDTKSIVIYMESVGNARKFLSAAREVAFTKPIIVIKAGRTKAAAKAAASHTGTLAGSDEVLDAAFRRCGVLRVNTIAELFHMAEVLAKQPRPKGPRLTILTNAGGPGVLATDALITSGGELAELSEQTMKELDEILPAAWSHNNPVDILGDAAPERYAKALEIAARDENSDGMLVALTPQAMTDPTETAEALKPYAGTLGKPVLASWMGGGDIASGETILNRANIPTFPYPDEAARIFQYMWKYTYNQRGLYETPSLPSESDERAPDRAVASDLVSKARDEGRTILTEYESKKLLSAYKIPTVETLIASDEEEAVRIADNMGYPVAVKLHSETITHKTDVGGVKLNLEDGGAVREAFRRIKAAVSEKAGAEHFAGVAVQPMINVADGYELILGSALDPQFGPVLLFGSGGSLVEVYKDRALALPPLNSTLALRMMEQTKIFKALKGVRGRDPVDLSSLKNLVVLFSQLVVEQPWIKEIDINPLLAKPDGSIALDARVILHDPDFPAENLPQLAIRPYPTKYVTQWELKDGTPVIVRPIRPEDEPLLAKFHESLSERSVYFRYMDAMKLSKRIAHERLSRICFIDYDREMALVAERVGKEEGDREILGVGRLSKRRGLNEAEFAVIISDLWQQKGLGSRFMEGLVKIARDEKIARLSGKFLPVNEDMKILCKKHGFRITPLEGESLVEAELLL